jgi:hypothetical protein
MFGPVHTSKFFGLLLNFTLSHGANEENTVVIG